MPELRNLNVTISCMFIWLYIFIIIIIIKYIQYTNTDARVNID